MLAYSRERLPVRTFGPIAAAIACPAHLPSFAGSGSFAIDAMAAGLLLAQFRLWDDLVDRERDRMRHPHRVLVRAANVGTYIVICLALGAANVLALVFRARTELTLPLLAALTLALAFVYTRDRQSAALDLLRLAKYPVFVLLIALSRPDASTAVAYAGAAIAFVTAITYEAWHDPESPLRLHRSLR